MVSTRHSGIQGGPVQAADTLVTDGIYAHVGHPQYLGIFLVTSGFLLQWITIPTTIMFLVLVLLCYSLAKKEERDMVSAFGNDYLSYKSSVPMFLPKLHQGLPAIGKANIARDTPRPRE